MLEQLIFQDNGYENKSLDESVDLIPPIKWPGGKFGELNIIRSYMPKGINRYIEPFLGGGAVFWSINPSTPSIVNDRSEELINFYTCIKFEDSLFYQTLMEVNDYWGQLQVFAVKMSDCISNLYSKYYTNTLPTFYLKSEIGSIVNLSKNSLLRLLPHCISHEPSSFIKEIEKNLLNKIVRIKIIEENNGFHSHFTENIETAIKSALYMYLRHLYNKSSELEVASQVKTAIFFFLREYSYASMFRYNKKGDFNVPYGGMSYNRKDFSHKINNLKSSSIKERLNNAIIENLDFAEFLEKHHQQKNDFLFFDPPYDSNFSKYDDNTFSQDDHVRLANYIYDSKAKIMLVIKSTPFILSLYENKGLSMYAFDKKYLWTIKERNDRNTVHLLITNY